MAMLIAAAIVLLGLDNATDPAGTISAVSARYAMGVLAADALLAATRDLRRHTRSERRKHREIRGPSANALATATRARTSEQGDDTPRLQTPRADD